MSPSLCEHFEASRACKCDFSTSFRKRKIEKKILPKLGLELTISVWQVAMLPTRPWHHNIEREDIYNFYIAKLWLHFSSKSNADVCRRQVCIAQNIRNMILHKAFIVANPIKRHKNLENWSKIFVGVYLWRHRCDDIIMHVFKPFQRPIKGPKLGFKGLNWLSYIEI